MRRKLEPHVVTEQILPLLDDPSLAGQTQWTLTKLCGYLRQEKQLDLAYRTLNRYLHGHRYARKIPRRMTEPPDRQAWEIQRKDFANELADLLADPCCVIFFGNEAGFEGDPRPRLKLVKRGIRPVQGYPDGHLRRTVIGAVNPSNGQLVSLIVPHCDAEVFQAFLDTLQRKNSQEKANGSFSFWTTPAGTRPSGWTDIISNQPSYHPTARTSTPSNGPGSISKATTLRASSQKTGKRLGKRSSKPSARCS